MSRTAPLPGRARRGAFVALAIALAVAFAGFVALGAWQLQRMQWKHDLIARVEARVGAPPVALPPRARWPSIDARRDEYRRVRVSGSYLANAEARTQAVTELGAGHWVLTALRAVDGGIVLVNRGFVPIGAQPDPAPAGPVVVTGLLRITEPGGGFLRRNDPRADRWYSRDVAAIAEARGLPPEATAPFFVDAEAAAGAAAERWPRAGMTVVRFRDPHLTYALTWFALAALTAWAALRLRRFERRRSERAGQEIDT
ncbi:SURF1 family protein [Tolypothrix campylonemoides VB511288]|nr:SURF1 family protein [Tolypothrix campylonemoides VB511288]